MVSRMGTEEVLVVRDRKDNQIRAFLNSCRHRGEKVCRYDQGNGLVFTCPFHAWTYDTTGRLVGIGYGNAPDAYNGEVNKEEWGLSPVAQFKNFYGSLWATWDPKAPSFEEYLGPFTESLRHCLEGSDGLAESPDVPWDRVHAEAEVLEHVLSEELEALIAAKLGNPTVDPHGDPIPTADLEIEERATESLADLDRGARATFVRISDSDPEMLRYLAERGIAPGDSFNVIESPLFWPSNANGPVPIGWVAI